MDSEQYGPPLPPGNNMLSSRHSPTIMDLANEATFKAVLELSDQEFYPWLSSVGLVGSAETFVCPTCGGACKFLPRANRKLCFTFRCRNSKNHEFSLTKFSFFEKPKVDIRALLRFVRGYVLDGSMDETVGNARLDWAAFTRDIFVETVCRSLNTLQFCKEVEINDALVGTLTFDGRSVVHNVWLFGITQSDSNQVLLFPVLDIDEGTVIRILQRFVDPGSRIVTAPGSFYSRIDFRSCGFDAALRNPMQTVRNNKIWGYTKAHFRKFAESNKLLSFESLVCEIIWRSWRRLGDMFTNYLNDLRAIYTLKGSPERCSSSKPIFDTWVGADDYPGCNFNFSFVDTASPVVSALPSSMLMASSTTPREGSSPGLVSSSNPSSSTTTAAATSSTPRQKVLGPQLPPGLQRSVDSDELSDEGQLTVKMESPSGNTTQDSGDSGEEGEDVGPMPSEMTQAGEEDIADEFERRSKKMKDKLTVKAEAEEGPIQREEWMTELPPEMSKNFGLQSRTFSKSRAGDTTGGDRSVWTDTPAALKDKDKGKKRKRDEEQVTSQREEQMQMKIEEFNKANRPESLLEMHTKKQKKKKKKEKKEKKKRKERGEKDEKEARRPFDRDLDLQANRFDDAQRKLIIQKSAALNTRFNSGGSTSSFL